LEIEALEAREVFSDALLALAELLGIGEEGSVERSVLVSASDRPALLAGWLEELVFLAESEGFVATGVGELDLRSDALDAVVLGVLDDPPPLVKAVTYHRLVFEPRGAGYVARVVLDV
jgi:SHS2 domain-containing protein